MVFLAALLAVAVVMAVTAIASRRVGRVSVVDVAWGLLFVVVAWVVLALGEGSARSWLLAALTTVWGGRLAWHLHRRSRGEGEDPRYVTMLSAVPEQQRFSYAVRKVFVLQAVVAWFVALPLQVAATTDRPLGVVAWVGVAVFTVGLAFEVIGDTQLRAFKADPANRGKVMDRGLWAYTRHPNHFGDSMLWWGLFVVAAEAWPGVLTILSPVAMTYFLAFTTGARLLEGEMAKRPGYPEYMARTSMFLPLPPRRWS